MILTFNAITAREILAASKASKHRRPTFSQMYDPAFWRDDLPADRVSAMKAEIANDGYCPDVMQSDVDTKKIPAGLFLVGDHGVYLMSNATNAPLGPDEDTTYDPAVESDPTESKKPIVIYAKEVDPENMEFDDWYDNKRDSFGGDDGVEFLSEEMLEEALRDTDVDLLFIRMSEEALEILTVAPVEDPSP